MSIGVPVRNGGDMLERALKSLSGQTYSNIEIIISDNCSTDETPKRCKMWAEKDPRIRFIQQPQNIGACANFREVALQSQGTYFMWAAHDDWRDKNFVSECVEKLQNKPTAAVAMSSFYFWKKGEQSGYINYKGTTDPQNFTRLNLVKRILHLRESPCFYFFIYGLFRRDKLMDVLYRPIPNTWAQDVLLMVELALLHPFVSVEKKLFHYTSYPKVEKKAIIDENYSDEGDIGAANKRKFVQIQFTLLLLKRLWTLRKLPIYKKLIWIPLVWVSYVKYRWPILVNELHQK